MPPLRPGWFLTAPLLLLGLVPIAGCTGGTKFAVSQPLGTAHLYITDTNNNRIVRVDLPNDGKPSSAGWVTLGGPIAGTGVGQFNRPSYITVIGGEIYVSDTGNNRIVRMDDITGKNWTTLGSAGSGAGQFSQPHQIAYSAYGSAHFYVADSGNDRIAVFHDFTGTDWSTFGATGSGDNQFSYPFGISFNDVGFAYISDRGNNRVVYYGTDTTTGKLVPGSGLVAGPGAGASQVMSPGFVGQVGQGIDSAGITADGFSVADTGNNRVDQFDYQRGSPQTSSVTYSVPGLKAPLFVDSIDLFVADTGNDRIVILDSGGNVTSAFGTTGAGVGQFSQPSSAANETVLQANGVVNVH